MFCKITWFLAQNVLSSPSPMTKRTNKEQPFFSPEFTAGAKFAFACVLILLGIFLAFHLIVAIVIGIPLIVIGGGLAAKYWSGIKKL